ncbi:MAG: hypothetical protein IJS03_05790 [Eubacterium sp.]|nr:hypothetical protein [Eubacterium sp.]
MKRLTLILLALAVVCSCFAACSKKTAGENDDPEFIVDTIDGAYADIDSATMECYSDICNAVYNCESKVRVNKDMVNTAVDAFYASNPLSVIVKEIKLTKDKSFVSIKYNFNTNECKAKVQTFKNKVCEVLKDCKLGEVNDSAFAVNAYHYVANGMQPENSITNAYDAILAGAGDSTAVSSLLSFVLRQGGIKTYIVKAKDKAKNNWQVVQVELDSELYYMDPISEAYSNKGTLLTFFGMTTDELKAEFLTDFKYLSGKKALLADNPYFDACRECYSFNIDYENEKLLITRIDGEIVEIALK